jgi:hypothetical protein
LVSESRSIVLEAKYDITGLSREANIKWSASRDVCLVAFDGPKAPYIPVVEGCEAPGYHGGPPTGKGWVYNWAEEGGSQTSHVRFDAKQKIQGIAKGEIDFTSKEKDVSIKASRKNVNIQAGETINNSAAQDINLEAQGSYNLKVIGTANAESSSFNFSSPGDFIVSVSGTVSLEGMPAAPAGPAGKAATSCSTTSVVCDADSTAKSSADAVVDHMIRPDYESWVRDEDEPKCKTPHGPNWQG